MITATSKIAPTAAPTPMPACAPVLSPLELDAAVGLGAVDVAGELAATEAVSVAVWVALAVEDVGKVPASPIFRDVLAVQLA